MRACPARHTGERPVSVIPDGGTCSSSTTQPGTGAAGSHLLTSLPCRWAEYRRRASVLAPAAAGRRDLPQGCISRDWVLVNLGHYHTERADAA